MSALPPDRDALARLVAALNAKLAAVQTDLANLLLWLAGETESVSPAPNPPPTSCPAPETASVGRPRKDVADRPQARLVLVTLKKAAKALTADALAYLAGKREGADGGFRGLLARMRRRTPPLLRRTAEGYALTEAGKAIADGEDAPVSR